jgi:hypothetical protein
VKFFIVKVAVGQIDLQALQFSDANYHSTNVPYLYKWLYRGA